MSTAFAGDLLSGKTKKGETTAYPDYFGKDLGLTYSAQESTFRIWAPTAEEAFLLLYTNGIYGTPLQTTSMEKKEGGTWFASLPGDWKGKFYVFRVKINGRWMNEVPDPYAKATGVNGQRAMVIDLQETNPPGWEYDKSPAFKNPTDAVIYEVHIRDISVAENSGIINKGKFAALTETGTTNNEGLTTGLDHIKELGITHVHLLPVFDFSSVDEACTTNVQYNWGYDPLNYNVPEGSYSSNPFDGTVRIKELKQLIQTLHENGLRVVMDVAYNHTGLTENSYFNQLVPGYYYRLTPDGKYSDATACGNETASERFMMRQFMLESLKYWVNEYHVDGFRFDLMGTHDMVTMNNISKELHKLKPDILLYGEGWTVATSVFPESESAFKKFAYQMDNIAVFSDDIRDGIKGNVFIHDDKGFVNGGTELEETIKFGVVASCNHPQIDYSKINYSKVPYAGKPSQTVTYCDCHDNHTLWDKLALASPDASEDERKEMQKLALSIVLTSQGISFLHAGSEFLRSKNGDENSFNSGDAINAIDWELKSKNNDVFEYVKALILMRKEHPAFRMKTAEKIQTNIEFEENLPAGVVAYTINGAGVNDQWRKIKVYYNGNAMQKVIPLESKKWTSAILGNVVMKREHIESFIILEPYSCTILYKKLP